MKKIEYPVHVRRVEMDKIRLYFIGDIHFMARTCDLESFHETIEEIKNDKHAYWIGAGDYAEHIYPGDHRMDYDVIRSYNMMDISDISEFATRTFQVVTEEFKPIADKCIGLIKGNHEMKFDRQHFRKFVREMAQSLGDESLYIDSYESFIILQLGKDKPKEVVIWISHGFGGGTEGNQLNRLMKMGSSYIADIYASGHTHSQPAGVTEVYAVKKIGNTYKTVAKKRAFVKTGSFRRKDPANYDARAGMGVNHPGPGIVEIDVTGKQPDFKVIIR